VFHHFVGLLAALVLFTTGAALADDTVEPTHLRHRFARFTDCEFIDTAYADGDSFRVRVDGHERVARGSAPSPAKAKRTIEEEKPVEASRWAERFRFHLASAVFLSANAVLLLRLRDER
jgi:hypothetical protein